jgi:hypothetical protein
MIFQRLEGYQRLEGEMMAAESWLAPLTESYFFTFWEVALSAVQDRQ